MALILSGLVIAGSLRTVTCNKAALLECVVLILSPQLVVKLIMGNTSKKSEFITVLVIEKGQCCGAKLHIKAKADFAQYCFKFYSL